MSDRPELANMFNRWVSVAIVVAALVGMTYILVIPSPRLPTSIANGTYSNPCCISIELRDGRMTVNRQFVSYVIETDKIGAYVLPTTYVGISQDSQIEIDHKRYPLFMRLNSPARPTEIEILGERSARFIMKR